jgi:hypothetical protein
MQFVIIAYWGEPVGVRLTEFNIAAVAVAKSPSVIVGA